jgi:hypothetical protein
MRLPGWVRSRWFIVPTGLLAIVVGWNIHVARNATGEVRGRVVDAAGRPVAGATVQIFERAFVVNTEKQIATTDANGTSASAAMPAIPCNCRPRRVARSLTASRYACCSARRTQTWLRPWC